jgi:ubiquinone/menaquinone biosynthesis C-methylase UbiE
MNTITQNKILENIKNSKAVKASKGSVKINKDSKVSEEKYPDSKTDSLNPVENNGDRGGRGVAGLTKATKTDWGTVADKYDKYLNSESNYHNEIIFPNIKRLLGDINGKNILDIACGQGIMCEQLKSENKNAKISGFDMGEDLVKIAKQNTEKNKSHIKYFVANAENFYDEVKKQDSEIFNSLPENKIDIAVCVLAFQNIENVKKVLENMKSVSKESTKVLLVINHPAYRIPKNTQWGYATEENNKAVQYRRVDRYMSEDKIKMDMTPAEKREQYKKYTYSFHRPLQYYFKLFSNTGFAVTRLEEWTHKESEGKHAERENTARKEFPMFMCLELCVK